jgi:hypothetical protein
MAPGLDFYVFAVDILGQAGKSPKIQNPSKEPYTIFVDNDIPSVEVLSVACEDSTTDIKTFSFKIKDSDGVDAVKLYFRDSKTVYSRKSSFPMSTRTIRGLWSSRRTFVIMIGLNIISA